MVSVPNEKNIIPYQFDSEQNREEAAKNGKLGGRASGAARRRKRALKEAADLYLSLPPDRRKWNALARRGVDPEDIDNQMLMIAGLHAAAAEGDARAGRLLVDILGESAQADPAAGQLEKAAQLLGGVDSVIE